MNKLSIGMLLAASLFLVGVAPAAAHEGGHNAHRYSQEYRVDSRRINHMPRSLRRDQKFRRWYQQTPLKRYRSISWRQMYDIYRWERRYFLERRHRQGRY